MGSFIQNQIDYIYFIYGFSFFMFAAVAFLLSVTKKQSVIWRWLGLFGLTYGITTWLNVLTYSVGDTPDFLVCRNILTVISFLFLIEGARLATAGIAGARGRWIYIPFLLMVYAGSELGGRLGMEIAMRYALGCAGGVWAATAIYHIPASGAARRCLAAAACLVGVFALSNIVVSAAEFFPASALSYDTFMRATGIPIQLVRVVAVMCAAVALWLYWYFVDDKTTLAFTKRHAISIGHSVIALSVFAAVMLAGWFITEELGRYNRGIMLNELLSNTRTAAMMIDTERLARLTGAAADLTSSDYRFIKRQLADVRSVNILCTYTYLMGHRDGKVFFFVDSGGMSPEDQPAPPGEIYGESTQELVQSFRTGRPFIEGPVEDKWGVWVSALVPIRDPRSGVVAAVFGMDVDARSWARHYFGNRLLGIIVTLVTSILIVGLFVVIQLEKNVRGQFAFIQTLIDTIPAPIFYKDAFSRYLGCNTAFEKDIGVSKDALIGKTVRDITPDRERAERYAALDDAVFSSGKAQAYEGLVRYADGVDHSAIYNKAPFFNSDGSLAGLVGVITDITVRKRAEEELRSLSTAIVQSPSVVVITDTRGNVEYVNPRFTKLTGYAPEEARGKNPRMLKTGDKRPDEYKELWDAITSGKTWRGEFCNRKKDGGFYWEAASISAIRDERGTITHFLKVAEDITDRKNIENMKADFVNTVSHELRTPLTAIKESVGIIYDGACGPVSGEQKEYLEMARRNVERLSKLISDMLDFQKLGSGASRLVMTPAKLDPLIEEVRQALQPLATKKGLGLTVKLAADLPEVSLDRLKIMQVLTNLVNNAIKFTDKGSVVIETARHNENALRVSVTDTGIGVKNEDLEKLFLSFSIVATPEQRKAGSAGLGLVIAREIIQKHGGKIWVESVFGKGSTFSFILPVVERRKRAV